MLMICSNVKFQSAIPMLVAFAIAVVAQIGANQTTYAAIFQANPFEVTEKEGSTTRDSAAAGSDTKVEDKVFELTADNERSNMGSWFARFAAKIHRRQPNWLRRFLP